MKRYYYTTLTIIDQYRDDFLINHSCVNKMIILNIRFDDVHATS